MNLNTEFTRELQGIDELKEDKKDAKKVQKIDEGITCQKKVLAFGAETWGRGSSLPLTLVWIIISHSRFEE